MPIELIVATFEDDETKAGQALERAQQLADSGALVLEQAAVIVKSKDGAVDVTDIKEFEPKKGRLYGAITGGLVGLLAGPVGAVVGAAAGVAAGGAYARIKDHGVSDNLIEDVEKGLQPGSSALIVYAQLAWVDKAIERLEEQGATVTRTTLNLDDLSDSMHADL